MSKIIFLILNVFFPGLLLASVIFFPADGRKKRDNPADQRGTHYQGFETTTNTQRLIILNEAALNAGTTTNVELSNAGWRPAKYKLSFDPTLSDAPNWTDMPASRKLTIAGTASLGPKTVYGKFLLSGGTETSASVSYSYLGKALFVDITNGSDSNPGDVPTKPLKTLPTALTAAAAGAYAAIHVAVGNYTRVNGGLNASGDGLTISQSGLKIMGGYTSDFSTRVAFVLLDAQNVNDTRVVSVANVSNLIFDGFHLRGGSNAFTSPWGGGLLLNGVSYSVFSNLTVGSNTVSEYGGGIAILGSRNVILFANLLTNFCITGGRSGGGLYLSNSSYITNNIFAERNGANVGEAVYISGANGYGNYLTGMFRSNFNPLGATQNGAIHLSQCGSVTLENCIVTNNQYWAILIEAGNSALASVNQSGTLIKSCRTSAVSPYGHFIEPYLAANDIYNHTIQNHTFVTNGNATIYYDNGAASVTPITFSAFMNTPLDLTHDALVAGNAMTSFP